MKDFTVFEKPIFARSNAAITFFATPPAKAPQNKFLTTFEMDKK